MKEFSMLLNSEDMLFILRRGVWVFFVFLCFGGFVTYKWVNHIIKSPGKPIYSSRVKIDLNRMENNQSKPGSEIINFDVDMLEDKAAILNYKNSKNKPPEQIELYNVAQNYGVTLMEERKAYSDLLKGEKNGPLKIKRWAIGKSGLLYIWINVPLHKNDNRIASLVKKLNTERSKVIIHLEKKLIHLKKRKAQLAMIVDHLTKENVVGKNSNSLDILTNEIRFINLIGDEISQRLPTIRQPIKTPVLEMTATVATPVKSFFACAIAMLVCAVLSGFLTGVGMLIRKRRYIEST